MECHAKLVEEGMTSARAYHEMVIYSRATVYSNCSYVPMDKMRHRIAPGDITPALSSDGADASDGKNIKKALLKTHSNL